MTFDLAVWDGDAAPTGSEAHDRYRRLCQGVDPRMDESAKVRAFVDECELRWPGDDGADLDASPWASWPLRSQRTATGFVVNVRPSVAVEMLLVWEEMAARHGLVLYDPQRDRTYLPSALQCPTPLPSTEAPRGNPRGARHRRPSSLLDDLTIYRSQHPVEAEEVQATIIGWPEGAVRRGVQRAVGLGLVGAVVGVLVGARLGAMDLGAVAGLVLGSFSGITLRPEADLPAAVQASTQRVIVARARRKTEPSVSLFAAGVVTHATIDPGAERFWVRGRLSRVRLDGGSGVVAVLDLPAVDPVALQIVFDEAGIAASLVSGPTIDTRPWLPRAFVVGLLLFLGATFVLLSLPAGHEDGVGSGLEALGIGLAFLLAGEGARRWLFRPAR